MNIINFHSLEYFGRFSSNFTVNKILIIWFVRTDQNILKFLKISSNFFVKMIAGEFYCRCGPRVCCLS